MNLRIIYSPIFRKYFIEHPNNSNDSTNLNMVNFFNISYEKYKELLIKHNAVLSNKEYYFEIEEDAQKFLDSEELSSYLILF